MFIFTTKFIAILLLLSPLVAMGDESTCELFFSNDRPKHLNGKLTPYWAQEFIGNDLANIEMAQDISNLHATQMALYEEAYLPVLSSLFLGNELRLVRQCYSDPTKLQCTSYEKHVNWMRAGKDYVCGKDQYRPHHGTQVAGLIFNETPMRAAGKAQLAAASLWDGGAYTDWRSPLYAAIRKNQIRILSVSRGFTSENSELESLVNTGGLIVVGASGNGFPRPAEHLRGADSVVVTSLSILGTIFSGSQAGENVTIAAPSDLFLNSYCEQDTFGATSGAQPLVAGSIANLESYLPGISLGEVKKVLEATAIPTKNNLGTSRENGEGTLNALKLVFVAKRLKKFWPENREKIFKNSGLYNFEREAQEFFASGEKLLLSTNSCQQKQGLDLVRKAFLLNPFNENYRKTLQLFYEQGGLGFNAILYESLSGVNTELLKKALRMENASVIRASVLRAAIDLGQSGNTFIENELPLFYRDVTKPQLDDRTEGWMLRVYCSNKPRAKICEILK